MRSRAGPQRLSLQHAVQFRHRPDRRQIFGAGRVRPLCPDACRPLTIQIALLDWTRVWALRFYSERVRAAEPTIRATLDMAFALISFGIAAIAVVVAFLDTGIDPTRGLIGLVARRRYRQEPVRLPHRPRSRPFPRPLYGRLVIIKNIFSLVLTGGAAFRFESALMALIGGIMSLTSARLASGIAV